MSQRKMTIRPFTLEVIVYDDGCSAVEKCWRDDMGKLTYAGRVYLDEIQTARIMAVAPHKEEPGADEFGKLLAAATDGSVTSE